jgi:thymidylate kinase
VIDARAREILDATWRPEVAVVDAARPVEAVVRDVKAEVWARL